MGRHLLPMLVADGHHVRVLTRNAAQHLWLDDIDNIDVITGDIADAEMLKQHVQGCDIVINAAAKFRFWGRREEFHQTNVIGTQHVLDAAKVANVQQFIHVSSVVVIGNPKDATIEIDENHPTDPVDPYQETKLAAENLVRDYHAKFSLPVVILRPGAYYGPHGRYAFNKMFFEDPLSWWRLGVNGGRHYTFPTYIKDAARSILLTMDNGQPGETYNICSQYLTHREADAIISKAADISAARLYVPASLIIPLARVLSGLGRVFGFEPKYPMTLRSYIFNDWRVSIEKAKRELGFTPTLFETGVQETLDWYKTIGIWKPKS